jgi:hypothetical protein
MKWLERLLPKFQDKRRDLNQASASVTLSISRYRHMSKELQETVEKNNFAKYLIYEKGE